MNKYKAKTIIIDGIKFDSKDESEYYLYLKNMKELNEIKDFEMQKTFELQPKFRKEGKLIRAITYTVDFVVYYLDGSVEYIDVKGMETQQGILRKKMFDYKYPELKLIWMAKNKKWGINGWIDYEKLKKIRKENRKNK